VLLARMAIHKTDTMPLFDVLRWLDRTVVRLVSRFGEFVKDQPTSLKLPPRFVLFPAFMYHLRRSAYLQVFNSSPDETAVLRLLFLRAMCGDSVLMIQPTLHSYTMQAPAHPVLLDSSAIQPENILLLDTFFEVIIHHGEVISAWRKLQYDKQAEYSHFKDFLDVPRRDAAQLVEQRYPCPRLIEVGKGEPDARILYNRINPSRTHNSDSQYGGNPGELVFTDDAPLHVFMDHLKKLAVSQ
jgi:protein transport protein SEC23